MEIPMTGTQTQDIKTQYISQPQMTEDDLKKAKVEQEKMLDNMLPFLRKQEEYTRLKMSLLEMDVLLGNIPVRNVQGLLGLELMVREVQANGYLNQWATGQKEAADQRKKQLDDIAQSEAKAKEQWDTLTSEEQAALQADVEEDIKARGIWEGYSALSEIQKINIIMQTSTLKQQQTNTENNKNEQ